MGKEIPVLIVEACFTNVSLLHTPFLFPCKHCKHLLLSSREESEIFSSTLSPFAFLDFLLEKTLVDTVVSDHGDTISNDLFRLKLDDLSSNTNAFV